MPPRPREPQPNENTLAKFEQLSQRMLLADNDRRNATVDRNVGWIKFLAWLLAPLALLLWYFYAQIEKNKQDILNNRNERMELIRYIDRRLDKIESWETEWTLTRDLRKSGRSNKEWFFRENHYAAPDWKEN